jgi:hypothetical protein
MFGSDESGYAVRLADRLVTNLDLIKTKLVLAARLLLAANCFRPPQSA